MGEVAMKKVHLQAQGIRIFEMKSEHFAILKFHFSKGGSADIAQTQIAVSECAIGKFDVDQLSFGEITKGKSAVLKVVGGQGRCCEIPVFKMLIKNGHVY
jgi:hypothetical protein